MNIEIDEYLKNLKEGEKKLISQDNYRILLINHNGKIYAIDAFCSHEDESLQDGFVDDGCIECPKHGAKFDLSSGMVKALPAVKPIKTYNIIYENDKCYVSV